MPFRPPVEPVPLADALDAFRAAAEYAYSRGVSRNNARLIAYLSFLERMSCGEEPLTSDEAIRLWREVHEITWVLTIFKENIDPPAELLVRSLHGQPLEEYENDSGRNFFLELRAAIYFMRAGYQVTLGEECDVIAIQKNSRIFVECKRLYSEKKAKQRVRACYMQLETRLQQADKKYKNYGLAWVDPSPAMQKHFFAYTAYSEAGARHAARMDLVHFWKEWISKADTGKERRIFAIVLQMVWPSWIASSEGIRTGFTTYVLPGHKDTSFWGVLRARRLLDQLMAIEDR